jgi:hypothetical protein
MPKPTSTKDLVSVDRYGRLSLGTKYAGKQYRIQEQRDGDLVLSPMVTIHERELWLIRNPEALEQVRQGVREAEEGELIDLGSFADALEEPDEDED